MQKLKPKTLKDLFLETEIVKIKNPNSSHPLFPANENRFLVDTREAITNPDILNEIVNTIIDMGTTEDWCYDILASFSTGGIPLATALALTWNDKQIIIPPKSYIETQIANPPSRIIGDCLYQQCLLINDIASTGGEIVLAANEIRESGGSCTDAIVIVDTETGAEELCAKYGIRLHSCIKKLDFNDLL